MKQKTRDSRFELLRIISIVIIVLHHLILHVAIDDYIGISVNRIISQLYIIGGKLGVDCFLLITGYFGIRTTFRLEKAIKIELQVLTYSILFLLTTLFFFPGRISLRNILSSILPTTFGAYWYITAYMGVFFLSPFLNIVAKTITKKQYNILLITGVFMLSIAPTFLRQRNWVNELLWFMLIYMIGVYIKRFELELKRYKKTFWYTGVFLAIIVTWIVSIILMFLANHYPFLEAYVNVFALSNYSTFILITAFCLFMVFVSLNPFYNKTINRIASKTLGIYLIQSNSFVSSLMLWPWIKCKGLHKIIIWPVTAWIITFLICLVCLIIETLREKIFGRFMVGQNICRYIDKIFEEKCDNGGNK